MGFIDVARSAPMKSLTVSTPGFFVSPERIFQRVVNGTFVRCARLRICAVFIKLNERRIDVTGGICDFMNPYCTATGTTKQPLSELFFYKPQIAFVYRCRLFGWNNLWHAVPISVALLFRFRYSLSIATHNAER
jgi:hypothetical protein